MSDEKSVLQLRIKAAECRRNVLRMLRASGHGHLGGAFSAIDIITALYFYQMNIDPTNIDDPARDRFILSAGHKCLAQYAVLAEVGVIDKSILDTYGEFKSCIPGHPDMNKLKGVEANTGALGHGMSIAAGMAMGAKKDDKLFNVYVVTGDGELPEGSNWEAAAAAAKYELDNLCVFVDNNGLQISGKTTDVMNMLDIEEKFRSFGWATTAIDGNDMSEIIGALDKLPLEKGKPTMILLRTIKAKGFTIGENQAAYHFWDVDLEELDKTDRMLLEEIHEIESELGAMN